MTQSVMTPLTIKYNKETPNDYIQYFIKNRRIQKINSIIVLYPDGKEQLEDLVWLPEYDLDEETGEVRKSTIPFVKYIIREQWFLARLDQFKKVCFKKTK